MRPRDEVLQDLDAALEVLGECETQYRSEVALYGDAWPGAQLDVARCRAVVAELEQELKA